MQGRRADHARSIAGDTAQRRRGAGAQGRRGARDTELLALAHVHGSHELGFVHGLTKLFAPPRQAHAWPADEATAHRVARAQDILFWILRQRAQRDFRPLRNVPDSGGLSLALAAKKVLIAGIGFLTVGKS